MNFWKCHQRGLKINSSAASYVPGYLKNSTYSFGTSLELEVSFCFSKSSPGGLLFAAVLGRLATAAGRSEDVLKINKELITQVSLQNCFNVTFLRLLEPFVSASIDGYILIFFMSNVFYTRLVQATSKRPLRIQKESTEHSLYIATMNTGNTESIGSFKML